MKATEGHTVYKLARRSINIEALGRILRLPFVHIKPPGQRQAPSQVIWQFALLTISPWTNSLVQASERTV